MQRRQARGGDRAPGRGRSHWLAVLFMAVWVVGDIGCDGGGSAVDPSVDSKVPDASVDAGAEPDQRVVDAAAGDGGPGDGGPGDGGPGDGGPVDAALPPCPPPEPPPEALYPAGITPEGQLLAPTGRLTDPLGPNTLVEGAPTDVALDPAGRFAYVASASADDRTLVVLDLMTLDIAQTVEREHAFYGVMVSPDGAWVYATGSSDERVYDRIERFPIGEDGTVGPAEVLTLGGYPSGLALDPAGERLWVADFSGGDLVEVDTASWRETRRLELAGTLWDVEYVPQVDALFVTDLAGQAISVVDVEAWSVIDAIDAPTSPAGIAVDPQGGRLWVAVSGADAIATIDAMSREVVGWTLVGDTDFVDANGEPLPYSNVNALAYDPMNDRLYASLGADNAVVVFDAATMNDLGRIPTAWNPTDVALANGRQLMVVTEGKGGGAGPNNGRGAKQTIRGSVTVVSLDGIDLDAATARARAAFARPSTVFPYACDAGQFPIPVEPDRRSPIEHVIVIVKENKTFDCVFGDLEGMDVDIDPENVRWGERVTPNMHALAREYCVLDNFYTEVLNSDMGHTLLTATHLTEYVERIWVEKVRTRDFGGFQVLPAAVPDRGNWFSHLIDNGIDVGIFGEIVGMFAPLAAGGQVVSYSDAAWPGGPAVNYSVTDEDKARHFIRTRIEAERLPQFSYVLLPNDHTNGTDPGRPTPESMVADNDYAVGLIVEALSQSPYWPRSVVLVVQDDTQGCEDHVDVHRSILLVVGPWVRRSHVSHVIGSFISLFATTNRILGVPPLGRPDASGMPLWDCFTGEMDATPYAARPRIPAEMNPEDAPGAEKSRRMDWRSPDRNPGLGVILDNYRLWRMGRISKAEAQRRIDAGPLDAEDWDDAIEESMEESTAHDADWRRYQRWRATQGLPALERFGVKRPGRPDRGE